MNCSVMMTNYQGLVDRYNSRAMFHKYHYRDFPIGCPKIATRIRACAKFSIQNSHQKGAHARILVAIFGQPTGKSL